MSNLLPESHKASVIRLYRKRFLTVAFFALAILSLIGAGLLLPSLFLAKNDEAVLVQKRDTLGARETSSIAHSLALSISTINQKLGVFSATVPASPVIGSVIKPMLGVQGNSVKISMINFDLVPDQPGIARIRISGTAESRETLLAFTDRIKALPGWTAVDLPIMSFIKNSNVTFTISAQAALK